MQYMKKKKIVMCLAISGWHTQVNTLSAPILENRTTEFKMDDFN